SGTHDVKAVFWETARNSHALLAFFTLSNADVILARSILDRHDAGLYAGGLILVKAMLFLPQFVVIVAFPSMSNEAERRDALLRGIAVVLGLGVVGVLAAWLLSSVALVFIGGPLYSDIQGKLWIFAILGTLLSAIQLLVYSVVARQSQKSVYLIWLMLALLVVGATQVSSVGGMLTVVCLVDGALFLILLGISLWRIRTAPALDAEKATSRP
ncbi:MAG: Polysaccharide biosynthesis protein, partial [Nocardioidaceae bacterium]|nr:Polysaccharide biosynthesis protein [Nocardioidaceae bacterium]